MGNIFENKIKNFIEYFTNNGVHMYFGLLDYDLKKFTSLTKETKSYCDR